VLIIKDKKIYQDNVLLKEIHCPKKMKQSDLQKKGKDFICLSCNKRIINTDHLAEDELVSLLQKDKNTCLSVNPLNPLFNYL